MLFGATRNGIEAVEIELDDGFRRSATVVRADAFPFDLYVAALQLLDHPIARVRRNGADGITERIPFPSGL